MLSSLYVRSFVRILLLSLGLTAALPAVAQEGDSSSSSTQTQKTPQPRQTARGPQKIALETNESLFDIMAVLNACGYSRELEVSNPVRDQIRQDFAKLVHSSNEAEVNLKRACEFYKDHELADFGRNLAQYVSLALELKPAPMFLPAVAEADL